MSITGLGEQKEHLIPSLIRSCETGERLNFVPGATHDFIDVSDVVGAILNLSGVSARGIFEVGWGKRYSNQEVLDLVEKITGKKANITKVDSMRPYDNYGWQSTNFKARSWGWLPTKTLEQSISEMVEAYEKS
jgi:nucleoside-diphosphate-sugar epimerase